MAAGACFQTPRLVVENIGHALTMRGATGLGVVEKAAMVIGADGQIDWIGPGGELRDYFASKGVQLGTTPADPGTTSVELVDAQGGLVMPGIVDPHTHAIFDNTGFARAGDLYARLTATPGYRAAGVDETIRLTRGADDESLLASTTDRLQRMLRLGVTTVEVKTGYRLTIEGELRLLELLQRLSTTTPLPEVVPTLLACHFRPPEHRPDHVPYVDRVCSELIPGVAGRGLATFWDVFVDELPNAFTPEDARRVARAAADYGLKGKLHVDQTSGGFNGAKLAVELGVVSADHLDHSSEEGLKALAQAGVIGVLLPGCADFCNTPFPEAARYFEAGLRVALSTDYNPGSSNYWNPWKIAWLGVRYCGVERSRRMTPGHVLRGITVEAAAAIDRDHEGPTGIGRLEPGRRADFLIIDRPSVAALFYQLDDLSPSAVFRGGAFMTGHESFAEGGRKMEMLGQMGIA